MIKVRAFVSSLSVAGVLVLTACSKSDSPTAPRPSPTPSAATLTLTVSSSTAIAGQAVEARATVRQGNAAAPDGTVVNFTLPRQTCWVDKNGDNQQQNDELVLCYYFAESGEVSLAKATQGGVASAVWTSVTSGDVTVSASVGSVSATATVRFYAAESPMAAPRFFSINPSSGSTRGGYNATISGQWLCKAYLNGSCAVPGDVTMLTANFKVALRVLSLSGSGASDALVVNIPEGPLGSVDILLENGVGSETVPQAFTFVEDPPDYILAPKPVIYSVSPDRGSWRGGEEISIFGQNLCVRISTTTGYCDVTMLPTVRFEPPGLSAQVVYVSPNGRELRVITPRLSPDPPAAETKASITVTNKTDSDTARDLFLYTGAEVVTPVLYALSPNAGPVEGGTRVTIFGTGFQYPVQVLFGDREAQVVSSNFNQIVCVAPSIAPSGPEASPVTVDVNVVNLLTGKKSQQSLQYRYGAAMFVSGITPNSGYILGWTPATIYGQGFVAPVQVVLTFTGLFSGARIEAEVLSVSGTSIQVRIPPATPYIDAGLLCSQSTGILMNVEVINLGSGLKATGPPFAYVCSGGISGT